MNAKLEHDLRLYSGLVIAFFLVIHLLTAALGLISLSSMDAVGRVVHKFWSIPPLLVLLYGAFTIHIAMALMSLFKHRSMRLPVWNLLQIGFGLAMPLLLFGHAMGTRGADLFLDVQRTYTDVVIALWRNPEAIVRQYTLVVLAWTHLCLGLHFWLRHKAWYSIGVLLLYPLSLFIPVLAGMGFARAGFDTLQMQPETVAKFTEAIRAANPVTRQFLSLVSDRLVLLFVVLVILVFAFRYLRDFRFRNRGNFSVTHSTSGKAIKGKRGQTVLEVLRASGIAHASVCGGRGRCTTCRVRVINEKDKLPEPTKLEVAALQRVGAGPNIRLACQIRPTTDLTIIPLLQSDISIKDANATAGVIGQEQPVACMFADLRGSTTLGEKKLPYDVVFILNHFFIQLADALKATNGHYANFTGDGIMGLYGLNSDIETGCREALEGAVEIQRRMDSLNNLLAEELDEPLKVGIGIHCGVAIVGTMGPPDAPITSAIGDNINIAARLEALTKEYATNLLVSEDVLKNASVEFSGLTRHTAMVRGRGESVEVFVVADPIELLASAKKKKTQSIPVSPID